ELIAQGAREQHAKHVDVKQLPRRTQGDAAGRLHEGIRREHAECPQHTVWCELQPEQEMRFWSEARPSVQVDADKDRLEKKSQPLDSKAQAERGAVAAYQPGPVDPEL